MLLYVEDMKEAEGMRVGLFTQKPNDEMVWNLDHASIEITASAREIPGWQVVNDVAPQPITDRGGHFKGKVSTREEIIRLVPYGFTKVRVVAFPVVK